MSEGHDSDAEGSEAESEAEDDAEDDTLQVSSHLAVTTVVWFFLTHGSRTYLCLELLTHHSGNSDAPVERCPTRFCTTPKPGEAVHGMQAHSKKRMQEPTSMTSVGKGNGKSAKALQRSSRQTPSTAKRAQSTSSDFDPAVVSASSSNGMLSDKSCTTVMSSCNT